MLAVAREWVTDHSGDCSPTPSPSCGISKKTPDKDLPCQLPDEINEHILEDIVLTGLKEQNAARKCRVCSARESAVQHSIFVIDVLFSYTEVPAIPPVTL